MPRHTMGNHTLKFGANLSRYDITDYDPGIGSLPEVFGETMTAFFNGLASNFTQSFPGADHATGDGLQPRFLPDGPVAGT